MNIDKNRRGKDSTFALGKYTRQTQKERLEPGVRKERKRERVVGEREKDKQEEREWGGERGAGVEGERDGEREGGERENEQWEERVQWKEG